MRRSARDQGELLSRRELSTKRLYFGGAKKTSGLGDKADVFDVCTKSALPVL